MVSRTPGALLLLSLAACSGKDSAVDSASVDLWADYTVEPPGEDLLDALLYTPFRWPEQVCVDPGSLDLPEDTQLTDVGELCVWDNFSGNVPEGLAYTDILTCDRSFTQGPSWFTPPQQVHASDNSLLDDEAYVTELEWVSDQILTSGCACCHASEAGSGYVSGFDVSAPAVWTDSMTNAQLAMAAGLFPEHSLFGHYEADVNHGFDRTQTLFASTDPERMKAFFAAEMERRGADQHDLDEAQGQFDALFGRLFETVNECVSPYEGIVEDKIVWNGDGVRQIYVLEPDAHAPGFPPNLHLPEGTIWALFVDNDADPIPSGTLSIGEVPEGAFQAWPEDGSAPVLSEGTTYKLYASPDVMSGREANCTFTWNAPTGG